MSVSIDIENFPNLSSVLMELEKQEMVASLTVMENKTAKPYKQEKKSKSLSAMESGPPHKLEGSARRRLEGISSHKLGEELPRIRHSSAPCPKLFDITKLQKDPRLTEAAKKLNIEKLALLYEDIFKPFGFLFHAS